MNKYDMVLELTENDLAALKEGLIIQATVEDRHSGTDGTERRWLCSIWSHEKAPGDAGTSDPDAEEKLHQQNTTAFLRNQEVGQPI